MSPFPDSSQDSSSHTLVDSSQGSGPNSGASSQGERALVSTEKAKEVSHRDAIWGRSL